MLTPRHPLCSCFSVPGIEAASPQKQSRRRLLTTFACLSATALASKALAQPQVWRHSLRGTCSFYPDDEVDAEVFTFGSTQEATAVVRRIAGVTGLQPNFQVLQANVPNASAVIRDQQRYILYSQVFISEITRQTASEWGALTIMAHEVGHHLNGHTLQSGGSRPPIELEADEFAGFAVGRLGGSLQQAQSSYQDMSPQGSATHPPRSARLEAVTRGHRAATAGGSAPPGGGGRPTGGNATPQIPGGGITTPPPPPIGSQSESILRTIIQQMQMGMMPQTPMTPQMQQVMLGGFQQTSILLRQIGPISQTTLLNQQPTPDGGTIYDIRVQFQSGSLHWRIGLYPNGTLGMLAFQPG